VRRAVTAVATACLLTGPTALAFFSGGYFAEPRLIAGLVAWTLVLALAIVGPAPVPRTTPGWVALAGLGGLTVWSAVSIAWAPLGGPASDAVQRGLLYTAALLVAVAVFRSRAIVRAVEPVLAAGTVVVIGYGLAGRLVPGVVELSRSQRAGGRLEQPITYWNAEGALAAVGFVLCAAVAGDRTRPAPLRAAAGAAMPLLGMGVYLSYSRGALAVAILGLVVLVAAAPSRAQLRAAILALAAGAMAAAVAAALPGVAALEGDSPERDGAIALAALVVIAAGAALAARLIAAKDMPPSHPPSAARNAGQDSAAAPSWARAARIVAYVAVLGVIAALIAGGLAERPSAAELGAQADAGRLTSVSSNRYEYWRVGLNAFADAPVTGLGAGGFRVEWLKEREISEAARDTHSLVVEVMAELGLPGLLALAALITGVVLAARSALRDDARAAAGLAAALLAWFLHAFIDWDWQLPAVTLPAVALAGALIAMSERRPADRAAPARPAPAEPQPDPDRA
jgi:O-Antigen ligase